MKLIKMMRSMAAISLNYSHISSSCKLLRQNHIFNVDRVCFVPAATYSSIFTQQQSKYDSSSAHKSVHYNIRGSEHEYPLGIKYASSFSRHDHKASNKYARFRSLLLATQSHEAQEKDSNNLAQQAVSLLAQKSRHTWNRLSPIIDLTDFSYKNFHENNNSTPMTIADIGCDHGLLAIALALSRKYGKIIGIDASQRALSDGALQFQEKLKSIIHQDQEQYSGIDDDIIVSPLEFRVGDGLEPLQPGEADGICIAGMGVDTMCSILMKEGRSIPPDSSVGSPSSYLLHDIGCTRLFLQPATSRPRHLMKLYKMLYESGWNLIDERISYLRRRWYITSSFERCEEHDKNRKRRSEQFDDIPLPGSMLKDTMIESMKEEYGRYINHHTVWLEKDLKQKGSLNPSDEVWLKYNQ